MMTVLRRDKMSGKPTIRDRTQKSGARRNSGGSIPEKMGQRSGRKKTSLKNLCASVT
jgi:hypothetical protein